MIAGIFTVSGLLAFILGVLLSGVVMRGWASAKGKVAG